MDNKCKCGKASDRRISIGFDSEFIECCNECSDRIKNELLMLKKNEEFRQGRSRENHEGSIKIMSWALVIITVIGFLLFINKIWNY